MLEALHVGGLSMLGALHNVTLFSLWRGLYDIRIYEIYKNTKYTNIQIYNINNIVKNVLFLKWFFLF